MEGSFGPAVAPPFLEDPEDPLDPAENSGSFILAVIKHDFDNFPGKMLAWSWAWLGRGPAWAQGPALAQGLAWAQAQRLAS